MKIGDSVSVIDDVMKGKIISLRGNVAGVEDEHGFTFEFPLSKLVSRDEDLYRGTKTVFKKESAKNISKKHSKGPMKLDLHFEKLVTSPQGYSAAERLALQKEVLLEKLEYCERNNLKKLEIIHGVGDGVLQRMVYEILENKSNLEFHNREILHEQSGTVLVYFY